MSERGTQAQSIVIIAVILGAAGLTFGIVSTVTLLTIQVEECPPGQDGQDCILDSNMYLCSSEDELLAAITDIGTDDGYIWIMQDITLNAMIDLNSGGGLTIQGITTDITIDVNGDYDGFNVSNVKSFTIRDLTIDISDIDTSTLSAISVAEINDHFVQIENVRILGNTSYDGRGITIQSDNVQVEDCHISQTDCGIYVQSGVSSNVIVTNNSIIDCGGRLIDCYGNRSSIAGNFFNGSQGNIVTVISGNNNTFINNQLKGNIDTCLWINGGDFNTISYNNVLGTVINHDIQSNYGFIIGNDADYNIFIGNIVTNFKNIGFEDGWGVFVGEPNCNNTYFIGNIISDNDVNLVDQGTDTYIN